MKNNMNKNPFSKPVDITMLPENTPERAYLEFAKAWQEKDYEGMLNACQQSWAIDYADATIKTLDEAFRGVELVQLIYVDRIPTEEMRAKGLNLDVVADLKACVKIKIGGKTKIEVFLPRVICESGYQQPDPKGKWGVNPVSCFKKRPAKR